MQDKFFLIQKNSSLKKNTNKQSKSFKTQRTILLKKNLEVFNFILKILEKEADIRYTIGQTKEALQLFQEVSKKNQDHLKRYNFLLKISQCLLELSQFQESKKYLLLLSKLDEQDFLPFEKFSNFNI
jgi:tetratricopeptide (TPR) repeat protein